MKRKFIGIEIDNEYFALAKERINQNTEISNQRKNHVGHELGYQRGSKLAGDFDTIFTDKPGRDDELRHLKDVVGNGSHVTVNSYIEFGDSMESLFKNVRHVIAKGGSIEFLAEGHRFDNEEQLALFESLTQFSKQAARTKLERGLERSKKNNGRPSQFTKSQMKTMVRQARKIKTKEDREAFCEKHGISRPYSYKLAKMTG